MLSRLPRKSIPTTIAGDRKVLPEIERQEEGNASEVSLRNARSTVDTIIIDAYYVVARTTRGGRIPYGGIARTCKYL